MERRDVNQTKETTQYDTVPNISEDQSLMDRAGLALGPLGSAGPP